MYYRIKLRLINSPLVRGAYRSARRWGGRSSRADQHDNYLASLVSELTQNRSFTDIGCMWGISGHFCFLAEKCGARAVTGVDVMSPTDEFIAKLGSRQSHIRFIQGGFHDPAVQSEMGSSNVVLCSGVLYHVPNPQETLMGLREICNQTLILATAAIPEMEVGNARCSGRISTTSNVVYGTVGSEPKGITGPYQPAEGFGNWIWGLSSSAIMSMIKVAGFSVQEQRITQFGVVFVCRAEAVKFAPVAGKSESPLSETFVNARLGEVNRDLWAERTN